VACETLASRGLVVVTGEITTSARVNYQDVVRSVIAEIGYTNPAIGFDANSCAVLSAIGTQSPDIALGVDEGTSQSKEQGAGDQGMMFGYACAETDAFMPFPIFYAHRVLESLAAARKSGRFPFLRPDSKSQLTVEYDADQKPKRIHTIVISHQHDPDVTDRDLKQALRTVAMETLPADMLSEKTKWFLNPTGRFVEGGPKADAGLTGRKIIVDTYGGMGRHGGGAFSGKDPSKVDRSAAYAARWVAKHVVAKGWADRCEVQVAYAIGIAEPVSIRCDTFGTLNTSVFADEVKLTERVREHFGSYLRPARIATHFRLRRPIYRRTAAYGHFGREDLPWETLDMLEQLDA
jgi:S-adenosylmethionine synthetase